jgi:hypothetical protein
MEKPPLSGYPSGEQQLPHIPSPRLSAEGQTQFPPHEVPTALGSLLTETITTVDLSRVEVIATPARINQLRESALGHSVLVSAVTAVLAPRLQQPEATTVTNPGGGRPIGAQQPEVDIVAEVKNAKPGIGLLSRVVGSFSPKAAGWIDGIIKTRVENRVNDVAELIEAIGSVESPKDELVAEIARIHEYIHDSEGYHYNRSPEDALAGLLHSAGRVREYYSGTTKDWNASFWKDPLDALRRSQPKPRDFRWLEANCPVIAKALPVILEAKPHLGYQMRRSTVIKAAAPEIIKGLEMFIQEESTSAAGVNFQDHSASTETTGRPAGFIRRQALRRRGEELAVLPDTIAHVLGMVHDVMPTNGATFRQEITTVVTKGAAMPPQQLIQELLRAVDESEEDETASV